MPEVFYWAQKAVLYPIAPLVNASTSVWFAILPFITIHSMLSAFVHWGRLGRASMNFCRKPPCSSWQCLMFVCTCIRNSNRCL